MKKMIKKAIVLLAVFVLTIIGYFIWAQKDNSTSDVKYTSIEDANLPVMYMEMFGRQMNCLHGYLQDGALVAGRDSLTVLPPDRQLSIVLEDNPYEITGIQYEIRSLDGAQLVERTVVESWDAGESQVKAVLPIQNMINKDTEYTLSIYLSTTDKPFIGYYTRILWTDSTYVQDMIGLAQDFSAKTFDYEQARELTTYLETEPTADNSSLGKVTLKSSFDQLTYAGLGVKPVGPVSMTLKELHGISANIQLNFKVGRTSDKGVEELYEISENFTMKWNAQRIYMMNYDREMNQIFSGEKNLYTGKRIMLGITDGTGLQTVSDEDANFHAFVVNRELWCLDKEQGRSIKVFSFASGEENDIRGSYDQHNIKILDVGSEGDITFLVYGYMNRGNHEGNVGINLYTYHAESNSIDELAYIPVDESFELLDRDLRRLSYLNSSGMLYILVKHAVYALDMSSGEYMVVAEALEEGSFAVSADGGRLAWQEGRELYGAKLIHLMDLESGKKQEIANSEGKIMKALGFVGNDFVYGLVNPGDQLVINGRIAGVPMYAMEIMGKDMVVQTKYQKEGVYLSNIRIQDSRIHFQKLVKSDGSFVETEQDTLVCNEELPRDELAGIGWFASTDRRKVYFVQLNEELDVTRSIRTLVPKKIQGKLDGAVTLKADSEVKGRLFYAYGSGRMLGRFDSFTQAVDAAYPVMGIVTDEKQKLLWVRADRDGVKTVKDVAGYDALLQGYLRTFEETGTVGAEATLIDARGCALNQVLYFVGKGGPVIAYTGEGTYLLIYGYDQYNISLYNPVTGETFKMGLNDGAAYFADLGNDFICTLFME